jgi:uncharacterized delta-60 repeat protein
MWTRAVASGRLGWQAVLVSAIVGASVAHAAPGDLDLTFAGTGMTRTGFGLSDDVARAVTMQVDGKMVLVGNSSLGRAIVRYDTELTLDESFGTGGKVLSPRSAGETATAMAIQADGKILVAGYYCNGSNCDFMVARHLPDGSPDASFDGDGVVITNFGGFDQANAMALQSDGKIVLAGSSGGVFAVARYHPDGSLDASFDGDGRVVTATALEGRAIMIQSSGKIVVAGGTSMFTIVRYNTNGSLDTTFDGDGRVYTNVHTGASAAHAVAMQIGDGTPVQPDKIVVAGSCTGTGINGQGFALPGTTSVGPSIRRSPAMASSPWRSAWVTTLSDPSAFSGTETVPMRFLSAGPWAKPRPSVWRAFSSAALSTTRSTRTGLRSR